MDLLSAFLSHGRSVTTDSRNIQSGDIFFALKGANFNGNQFAEVALQQGASLAIVDEDIEVQHDKIIKVENALKALQHLANQYRRHLHIPVIALTGSNGKTTTKELLACVLNIKYKLHFTQGNFNNEIGVPLTILKAREHHEMMLIEMGANHQGEIDALCKIAEPNYGFITNIGKAHLEGFGGPEGVKKGKSELYRFLSDKNGKIFLNEDDAILTSLIPPHSNVIGYSTLAFKIIEREPVLKAMYQNMEITTHLKGDFNVNNIAAAFAVGQFFKVDDENIVKAIAEYIPSNNRSQLMQWKGIDLVMDAYNANPSSMASSITSFLNKDAAGKVVILGDMFELGDYAEEEHKKIVQLVEEKAPGEAIFIGPLFFQLKDKANGLFFATAEQAKKELNLLKYIGKTILIKGSRGMALEKLLD